MGSFHDIGVGTATKSSFNFDANTIINENNNENINTTNNPNINPSTNTFVNKNNLHLRSFSNSSKNFFSQSHNTNLLHTNKKDNMSYVFPVVFLHNSKKMFKTNSEKTRFIGRSELFLKLKYLIDKDSENKLALIKEVKLVIQLIVDQFFLTHGIIEPEYYSYERLNNFYEFLNSDFNFKANLSIRDIIINGTLFNAPKSINKFLEADDDVIQKEKKRNLLYENPLYKYAKKKNKSNKNKSHSTDKDKYNYPLQPRMDIHDIQNILENTKNKIDFRNPNHVINEVEKELKNVKILPKSSSFITQLEENKNSSIISEVTENESKKKKKLLEYIMVIIIQLYNYI